MFSTSFKQIKAIFVCWLTILLGLDNIIGLYKTVSSKIKCRWWSFRNVLGVIIFRLSILDMILLIRSVVMIIVIKRIDFVSLSLGRRPYLILILNLFPLLDSGIGTLRVTFVPSVANNLIYHFYYLFSSYKCSQNVFIKTISNHLLNQLLLWLWLWLFEPAACNTAEFIVLSSILSRLSLSFCLAVCTIILLIKSGFIGSLFMKYPSFPGATRLYTSSAKIITVTIPCVSCIYDPIPT